MPEAFSSCCRSGGTVRALVQALRLQLGFSYFKFFAALDTVFHSLRLTRNLELFGALIYITQILELSGLLVFFFFTKTEKYCSLYKNFCTSILCLFFQEKARHVWHFYRGRIALFFTTDKKHSSMSLMNKTGNIRAKTIEKVVQASQGYQRVPETFVLWNKSSKVNCHRLFCSMTVHGYLAPSPTCPAKFNFLTEKALFCIVWCFWER